MKKDLLTNQDLKLLLEAAAVLAVGGAVIWLASTAAIDASLKEAGKSDRAVTTTPVTYKESTNIKVATPKDGDTLVSPFLISGQARVFEAVVSFRLKDGNGKIIVQGTAMAKEGQTFSPFSYSVAF